MSKKVFIGVGHGGKDPGAIGHVREGEANLTIALKLQEILFSHGVDVAISRVKDEDDPLSEEIREANAFSPDLAIDVHNNAGGGRGFEVYRQTNQFSTQSTAIAQLIEKHVKDVQYSRGIKIKKNSRGYDYFGFLRQIKAPAVICEGFFVDGKEAWNFDTPEELHKLSEAYAKGILEYLKISYDEKIPFYDDVKARFGFDENTMQYLLNYKYGTALLQKLATRG